MEVLGSSESDAEDAGSSARTREGLGGGFGRVESGPLRPPSPPVCAWSIESIPVELDRAGEESACYATRL
jgi:hypothetical protein